MSELRECPFCGGAAQLCYGDRWSGRDYRAFVRCTECCITPFMYRSGKKATQSIAVGHAIELWNTRPASRVETAARRYVLAMEAHHAVSEKPATRARERTAHQLWKEAQEEYANLRAALAQEGEGS